MWKLYRTINVEEALEYLNKEISEYPDDGYAYSWIAFVRNHLEEYGKALTAANMAIKKIPSKDKTYLSFAYALHEEQFISVWKIQYML